MNDIALLHEAITRLSVKTNEQTRLITPQGSVGNWLIDLRPVLLQRDYLAAIARIFWEKFAKYPPMQLAAIEVAAVPLLTALLLNAPADHNVSGFIVRKQRKTYGLGNSLEGVVEHLPVVAIDDLHNSGGSFERIRVVAQQHHCQVVDAFAVIDFESPRGLEFRVNSGINIHSIFKLSEFGFKIEHQHKPLAQFRQLWKTEISGAYPFHVVPKSTPLFVDNKIFRGSDAGVMHAFDVETGAILWEHTAKNTVVGKGIFSSPVFSNGVLYYGAYNGTFYALNALTGKEVWKQCYCDWIGSSPALALDHGLVLIGMEHASANFKGSIAALRMSDGELVWSNRIDSLQHGSACYSQKHQLAVWGSRAHVVATNITDGAELWRYDTDEGKIQYPPTLNASEDKIAFASTEGWIYLLSTKDGAELGKWSTDGICYTTPLFLGHLLVCGSGDNHLYVIDTETCEIVHKINLRYKIFASPILVGDKIYVGNHGGVINEIDAKTFEVTGFFTVPDAVTNAIAAAPNNTLFVSTQMNELYAFQKMEF